MLNWRVSDLRNEDGVLIGSDLTQEWLLPWWWKRYEKTNHHSVAFIDFGMSFEKKNWCRERGELIPLRLLDDYVLPKEKMDPQVIAHLEDEFGKQFWISRSIWFKKPFGFLQTPFRRTVWIDLDCEIRGSIAPLFEYANLEPGLAMILDPCDSLADYSYPIYNSGVVPFCRGIPLIIDWAIECIKKNGKFRGDQEILSSLIAKRKIRMNVLPPKFNWSRVQKESDEAIIYHWHGIYGKYVIRNQMTVDEISF